MQIFLSILTLSSKCKVYIYTSLLGISMQIAKEGPLAPLTLPNFLLLPWFLGYGMIIFVPDFIP